MRQAAGCGVLAGEGRLAAPAIREEAAKFPLLAARTTALADFGTRWRRSPLGVLPNREISDDASSRYAGSRSICANRDFIQKR